MYKPYFVLLLLILLLTIKTQLQIMFWSCCCVFKKKFEFELYTNRLIRILLPLFPNCFPNFCSKCNINEVEVFVSPSTRSRLSLR